MHRVLIATFAAAVGLAGCSLPGPFRPLPEAPDWSGYNDQVYTDAFMLMAQQAMVIDLAGPEGWLRFLDNVRVRVAGRTPEYRGTPGRGTTPVCTVEGLEQYVGDADQPCRMIDYPAEAGCNNRDLCVSFRIPAEIARRASMRSLITQMLSDPCATLVASGVAYPVYPDAMQPENAYAGVFMRPPLAFKLFRCREGRRVYGRAIQVGEDGNVRLSFVLE